jgi:hypothetical protein
MLLFDIAAHDLLQYFGLLVFLPQVIHILVDLIFGSALGLFLLEQDKEQYFLFSVFT